jgi:hypothetical protein
VTVSLKRKLVAGGAALLVAGGGTGAGLAASGHGGNVQRARQAPPSFRMTHAGFVGAAAYYLRVDVRTLRQDMKGGRTIAEVADATSGASAAQLTSYLVRAATVRLTEIAHRPLSTAEQRSLHSWLTHRVSGFLTDTCPLSVTGLAKHLAGCHGMKM